MTSLPVAEGWGNHDPEYDLGVDAGIVVYSNEPPVGRIELKVGDRIEFRSLPGVWTIDCLTNLRVMCRGAGGTSAQVELQQLAAELKTVYR